jgi:hypothetical protein
MNKRFVLRLLSTPVLFASVISMVFMGKSAHASQTISNTHIACVLSPHSVIPKKVCIEVSNNTPTLTKSEMQTAQIPPNQIKELAFSDKDSDEALRLFGCDCPVCINAARQLHGLAPLPV